MEDTIKRIERILKGFMLAHPGSITQALIIPSYWSAYLPEDSGIIQMFKGGSKERPLFYCNLTLHHKKMSYHYDFWFDAEGSGITENTVTPIFPFDYQFFSIVMQSIALLM